MKNLFSKTNESYTPYQRRLIIFLSVATFFEGYDFIALVQVLPHLVDTMGMAEKDTGIMVSLINVGSILAFFVVYLADRIGRRPVLAITIAGYTVCSLLTALVGDVWAFVAVQCMARVFLLGEVAVSMIYAAEEFPAQRRGRVIGSLQVAMTLGTILCAGITPMILASELGWRGVYILGAVPLIILAYLRRGIKETKRFETRSRDQSAAGIGSLWTLIRGPYRNRVLLIALIWALTYLCAQSLITFWNLHAIQTLGLTYEVVSKCVMVAALGSIPLLFLVGRLLELGRRRAAVLVYSLLIIATIGCYNLTDTTWLTVSLLVAMFSITGVVPILNAYTVELFPTESRASAFAWSNNILGRIGYVLSPLIVGWTAASYGYGVAVTIMAIFPAIALVLILVNLRETAGLTLEETSLLEVPAASELDALRT